MPLTYDLGEIAEYETVCFLEAREDDPSRGITKGDRLINPLTEVLIFATMGVGIGQLTDENAAEFYARLNFLERTDGPFLIRPIDPETFKRPEGAAARITPDEVRAHIGLSTNATFRDESRTKWMGRFKQDLDASKRRYQVAAEKAEDDFEPVRPGGDTLEELGEPSGDPAEQSDVEIYGAGC